MKTLSQILRPIAAPIYKHQRQHIYRQYKRMMENGMDIKNALRHAQNGVDSVLGNYAELKTILDKVKINKKRDGKFADYQALNIKLRILDSYLDAIDLGSRREFEYQESHKVGIYSANSSLSYFNNNKFTNFNNPDSKEESERRIRNMEKELISYNLL